MGKSVALQNLLGAENTSQDVMLTLLGVEYEFTWIETAVPAAGKAYAIFSTGANYALVGYREVQMDQERGFYRFYVSPQDAGTPGASVPVYNLRGDSGHVRTTQITLTTAPTIGAAPARTEIPMFGAAGQGNQPVRGDLASERAVRVVPPNTTILLELDNESASPSYMREVVKFWEVSPSAMIEAAGV